MFEPPYQENDRGPEYDDDLHDLHDLEDDISNQFGGKVLVSRQHMEVAPLPFQRKGMVIRIRSAGTQCVTL
jgi:hypothetical protein